MSIEAEQGLLGAIISNNKAYDHVCDILEPEYFTEANQYIYSEIVELIEGGKKANPITMKCVDRNYLVELSTVCCFISDCKSYADEIVQSYKKRELLSICNQDKIENLINIDGVDNIVDEVGNNIQELNNIGKTIEIFDISDMSKDVIRDIELSYQGKKVFNGVSSGYKSIDKYLSGGWTNSNFILLAAQSSMGKTSFAINSAIRAAKQGKNIVFFSLEMSKHELYKRILSTESKFDKYQIDDGMLSQDDFNKILSTSKDIDNLPLTIVDIANISVNQIRVVCKRLQRQKKLDAVFIDYLGLLRASDTYRGQRVHEVGEISRKLKIIAKELDVPMVVLSQLSRAVNNRDIKKPVLSDLRDSGNLEQDADIVCFIYRAEYYLEKAEPDLSHEKYDDWLQKYEQSKGRANFIISKNRHGKTANIDMRFINRFTEFEDFE